MKTKTHQFIVTVEGASSIASAKMAILCAFAGRQPDGCKLSVVERGVFQRRQHANIMRMCAESRKRMNSYTPEQRAELEKRAREIIEKGRPTWPST